VRVAGPPAAKGAAKLSQSFDSLGKGDSRVPQLLRRRAYADATSTAVHHSTNPSVTSFFWDRCQPGIVLLPQEALRAPQTNLIWGRPLVELAAS